jgi:prepilin signal peptidase PulO-like enzyme (type II secretory pathway)
MAFPLPLTIFLTLWFFCLGGCVGSFMNVVIFRLPRRRSIVSPASRCPQCGAAIRWYDNLPVLSWLVLRGKCRDCKTPIAARYPIVELLIGLIFLALAVQVFVPRGPWWLLNVDPQFILATDWARLGMAYAYYALLVCTLVCAAYVAWDGQHVPRTLFLPAIIAGALVPAYWNEVRPLAVSAADWQATALNAWRDGASGAALAFILGLAFDTVRDLRDAQGQPRGRVRMALAVCGWMLGPRAGLLVMPLACVVALAWLFLSGRRWRSACSAPLVGVAVATTLLVLGGRLVFEHWPPWGLSDRWLAIIVAIVTNGAAALLRAIPTTDAPRAAISPPTSDVMYP